MRRFEVSDRVRVDIPDTSDPDHDRLHGRFGVVLEVAEDDAGHETGDPRDAHLFRVEMENGETVQLRWRDLRPAEPPEGE